MNTNTYSTIHKDPSEPIYSSPPVGERGATRSASVPGRPGETVGPVTSTGTLGLRQNPAGGSYQSALAREVKKTGNTEGLFEPGKKRYEEEEELLMQIFKKEGGDLEEGRACKDHETNVMLANCWQMTGKRDKAQLMVLAMSSQEPAQAGALEEVGVSKYYETNVIRLRYLKKVGELDKAERLQLAMLRLRQEPAKAGDLNA